MPATHKYPLRPLKGGVALSVKLTPNASVDQVLGLEEGVGGSVLRVKVRAVPEKGKANKALIAVLAEWFDLPKSSLRLHAGETSRRKTVWIDADMMELAANMEGALALDA